MPPDSTHQITNQTPTSLTLPQFLEQIPQVQHLILKKNVFSREALEGLSNALGKNALLSSVVLVDNGITVNNVFKRSDGIVALFSALLTHPGLNTLTLHRQLHDDPTELNPLCQLLETNQTLNRLTLQDNALPDNRMASLLKSLAQHKTLRHLKIHDQRFGTQSGVAFNALLGQNSPLDWIDLSHTLIPKTVLLKTLALIKCKANLRFCVFTTTGAKSRDIFLALTKQFDQESLCALLDAVQTNWNLTAIHALSNSFLHLNLDCLTDIKLDNERLIHLIRNYDCKHNKELVEKKKTLINVFTQLAQNILFQERTEQATFLLDRALESVEHAFLRLPHYKEPEKKLSLITDAFDKANGYLRANEKTLNFLRKKKRPPAYVEELWIQHHVTVAQLEYLSQRPEAAILRLQEVSGMAHFKNSAFRETTLRLLGEYHLATCPSIETPAEHEARLITVLAYFYALEPNNAYFDFLSPRIFSELFGKFCSEVDTPLSTLAIEDPQKFFDLNQRIHKKQSSLNLPTRSSDVTLIPHPLPNPTSHYWQSPTGIVQQKKLPTTPQYRAQDDGALLFTWKHKKDFLLEKPLPKTTALTAQDDGGCFHEIALPSSPATHQHPMRRGW